MERVYFDNAATTKMSDEVIETMLPAMRGNFGNPSSIHNEGRKVRALLEAARKSIAHYLNASIGEIFFTSGGTEANNMALKCSVRDLGVKRIITSPIEHHCVLHTVEKLEHRQNIKVELLKVDHHGTVDYAHLEELLKDDTHKTLVSLMHANNEIGTLLDFEKVANLCEQYNALFHSDSVQTMGHFPIDVSKTKVHFLSCGAHKIHGPKGVGFLYLNGDVQLQPFIDGGSQERNMRGGTENVIGILGLSKAFEMANENMVKWKAYISILRSYFKEQLVENFDDIQFNSNENIENLYTVLSVSFPPSPKSGLLLLSLDIAGVSASGGSACSSGADVGSHVIRAIGVDSNRTTVRFSFSHYNTREEIDFVVEKLKTIIPAKVVA